MENEGAKASKKELKGGFQGWVKRLLRKDKSVINEYGIAENAQEDIHHPAQHEPPVIGKITYNIKTPLTREQRMEEYRKSKELPIEPDLQETPLVSSNKSVISSEEKKRLPSGLKEVISVKDTILVTPEQLPWLHEPVLVSLKLLTIEGSEEEQFYYGSVIKHKDLIRAANFLDEKRSNIVTNMLCAHLSEFIRNRLTPFVKILANGIASKNIRYVGNKSGQRAYFIQMEDLNDRPVIIRIAVCDKSQQLIVLSVITDEDKKRIKYLGKL